MTFDLEAQFETSVAAYMANAAYYQHASATEALAFATACQQLMMLMPQMQRQAGRFELQFDSKLLPQQLYNAQLYASLSKDVGVRGFDFTNFRDT